MVAPGFALALLSASLVPALAQSAQQASPLPAMHLRPCEASDLDAITDAEGGAFNGMSHSGALLIVRNLSPTACTIPAIPQLTLLDAQGKPLAATPDLPGARFMHPGPVVLPIPVAPNAEVTATLRWVSGPVYTENLCIDAAHLAVSIGKAKLQTQLGDHLCGERAKGVHYDLTRFATDPVYKPDPTPQLASTRPSTR